MNIFDDKPNVTIETYENIIRIKGQVLNIVDYSVIREAVMGFVTHGKMDLKIVFEDTNAITSSVIGFLLKIVQKDKVNLKVVAKNEDLYLLLEILGLINILKVTKIE